VAVVILLVGVPRRGEVACDLHSRPFAAFGLVSGRDGSHQRGSRGRVG
jgi:hypothetical protein